MPRNLLVLNRETALRFTLESNFMKRLFTTLLFVLLMTGGCGGPKKMSQSDKAKLYYDAGIGYINEGEPQKAIENLKMSLDLDRKNPQVMHALGLGIFPTGNPGNSFAVVSRGHCQSCPMIPKLITTLRVFI